MRTLRKSLVLACAGLAGASCVTAPSAPPPVEVAHCRTAVEVVDGDGGVRPGDDLRPYFNVCRMMLAKDGYFGAQRIVFGLSSDASGRLTSACVHESTLPDTAIFLDCVIDTLERNRPLLEPNADERPVICRVVTQDE